MDSEYACNCFICCNIGYCVFLTFIPVVNIQIAYSVEIQNQETTTLSVDHEWSLRHCRIKLLFGL